MKNMHFDKENINTLNQSNLSQQNNGKKFRNFGQQIKAKLQIPQLKMPQKKEVLKPLKNNHIYIPASSYTSIRELNKTASGYVYGRCTKVQTQPSQQKRKKSVKFNDMPLPAGAHTDRSSSTKSILKNSSLKKDGLKVKTSYSTCSLMKSSITSRSVLKNSIGISNIFQDDQSCDNISFNKSAKDKYEKIMFNSQRGSRKYTDQMFPPLRTSLESGKSLVNESNSPIFKQIKWMRISQLYKNKKVVVWSSQNKSRIVSPNIQNLKTHVQSANHIINVFNSIKYNNSLLERMFEDQHYNDYGVYFAKINHNNVWKYITIDDNIPVVRDSEHGKYVHAFFQVKSNTESKEQSFQLWPYLLLKALSKLYSNYESIMTGNQVQLLEDVTGCKANKIRLNSQADAKLCFSKLKLFNASFIVTDLKNQFNPVVPFYSSKLNQLTQEQSQSTKLMEIENPVKESKISQYSQYDLFKKFHEFYFVELYQYTFSAIHGISKHSKEDFILRSFSLQEITEGAISVIQKDRKVFEGTSANYRYSWIRVMIVMKQNSGYRWIGGAYSNQKKCIVKGNFQMGQYFVVIMPEWHQKPFDLSVLYTGNSIVKFQKRSFKDYPNIITESCMDIAQRFGTVKQINQNICSYNYINRQVGLIIENINNERHRGSVKVVRSVNGLVGVFPIEPVNQQFKNKNTIQIDIPSLNHFTVVLRLKGGIDKQMLDMFDFGS